MTELSYCAGEVKANDYYRYICCLFTPENLRERLFALYAFNFEISKIKDITSEPMTGLIRITWWKEALEEIYSGKTIRNHEVVKPLSKLIKSVKFPREYFDNMVAAREVEIGVKQLENFEELRQYLDDTGGGLLKSSMLALGANDNEALEAASKIGMAYALVFQLRVFKWNASKRRVIIPNDMLKRHLITVEDIVEGRQLELVKPIVRELCDKAEEYLNEARACAVLRKDAPTVYLHSIIAGYFINLIRQNNYDLFRSNLEGSKLSLLIKIFCAAKFGK